MTKTEFHILLCIVESSKHGYEIMKQARKDSNNTLKIGPGSLYTTIDRLLKTKLITHTHSEIVHGRERKYYQVTQQGKEELSQEARSYENVVSMAQSLALI